MKKLRTNATKSEFEIAITLVGGEVNPVLETKKKGQLASGRVPLKGGKVLHARYFKEGIIEHETEEPISKPIEHLIEPQIPIKKDFEKTVGKGLKKLGKKFWEE